MRLLRGLGTAELGKVASESATQGLWLGYNKVGSQVSSVMERKSDSRLKPIPWEKNSLGNYKRKKTRKESQR